MDSPVQNVVNNTKQELSSEAAVLISEMNRHHATVSYAVLAILVLVLSVGSFFGYRALKSADQAIAAAQARADKFEKQAQDDKKAFEQHTQDRQDDTKQQQVIVKVIHDRDQQADQQITKVNSPNITTSEAALNLVNTYGLEKYKVMLGPDADPDDQTKQTLEIGIDTAQLFTVTKIDRDRFFHDYTDAQSNLTLEQKKTSSLTGDLTRSQQETKDAIAVADKWEHAAYKSKTRKFLDGALKGLELAATGYAAFKLGQASHR